MGALNSKVLGEVATAYGDNSVYPSQELLQEMRIGVDGDRYRRRFRIANVSEILAPPSQTRRYKFRPGPNTAWLVHSGSVINDQAANAVNVVVSLIDPDNSIGSVVWAQAFGYGPGRIGLFIEHLDNSGSQDGYDHGPLYVPAGYELDIAITAVVAPFEAGAFLTSLYLEEVPRQEAIAKLLASEVQTT